MNRPAMHCCVFSTIALMMISLPANAEPPADDVVEWTDSNANTDYAPKSDSEGASWTFDPTKVSLNQGASSSGTNFKGARILSSDSDVEVLGAVEPGMYDDQDHERYWFWEGKTLYFGVDDPESQNSVDAIVEFYWFESSIPRGSDFYVMLVKVKSSPNPWDNWHIIKEDNMSLMENLFLFWQDVQPAQSMSVFMEPGGQNGSLRWDYSVPFETYLWEPYKVMQIQESYGAGYDAEGSGDTAAGGALGMVSMFSEGGAILDLTSDLLVQAKGNVNQSFKIETQYTVTHYRWMMLVQSGAEDMHYKMAVLPAEDDDEAIEEDSAYAEYFVVLQAKRGNPVHIDSIDIGGQFKRKVPFWFDSFKSLSASLTDIWLTPPTGVCLPGEIAPPGTCNQEGVCGMVAPVCSKKTNQWSCPVVAAYEVNEVSCDGLDNDCDGITDEWLDEACSTSCGWGKAVCINGKFEACDAPMPEVEICDGLDNDCDGDADEGISEVCETACGAGIRSCASGQWGQCSAPSPVSEICDGLDNDCDGVTDEGLIKSCETACGAGQSVCEDGTYLACSSPLPEAEICDGLDNDCDGIADEGLVRPCESACGSGYETCSNGSYAQCDAPQPAPEQCGDHIDNDCDGVVDNGCQLVTGPGTAPAPPREEEPTPGAGERRGQTTPPTPPATRSFGDQRGANGQTTVAAPANETSGGGCSTGGDGQIPMAPALIWSVACLLLVCRRLQLRAL